MNAPIIPRSILKIHVATVEQRHPITILGLLPQGSVGHVEGQDALEFLAEKKPGLDLFRFAQAEVDLAELLGRPVGLVLVSGLKGREATEFPRLAEPL